MGENGCSAPALNTYISHIKEAYTTCTPNTKSAPTRCLDIFHGNYPMGEGEVR